MSERGIELDKVTAGSTVVGPVVFNTVHGGHCHCGHDIGPASKTLTKSVRPVTDLADVYRDVGVFGCRGDGELKEDEGEAGKRGGATYWMPLEPGDFGNLDEEPLAGCVLEAWFYDAKFHCAAWVNEDL